MLMYCSTGDRKVSTWKPKKTEVITWKKLDTYYKFYEQYVVNKDYI